MLEKCCVIARWNTSRQQWQKLKANLMSLGQRDAQIKKKKKKVKSYKSIPLKQTQSLSPWQDFSVCLHDRARLREDKSKS